MTTTYFAIWHGTPDIIAVLVTTTRSLAKAERIVAAYAALGQPAYITTEHGCLMHRETGEVRE